MFSIAFVIADLDKSYLFIGTPLLISFNKENAVDNGIWYISFKFDPFIFFFLSVLALVRLI